MNHLKHKNRIFGIIISLFLLCFMVGCQKESNKFKLNDGMQFKETEKSQLEGKGNRDNGKEGKNKNPKKEGSEEVDTTMEEPPSQQEETPESTETEEETKEQETSKENQTEKQSENPSTKAGGKTTNGKNKDNKKDGEGGTGGGDKKYTPDYNGETIEIYVEVEDE